MNTDYGFFQLFRALKSLREYQIELAMGEARPATYQKLPKINYSLAITKGGKPLELSEIDNF